MFTRRQTFEHLFVGLTAGLIPAPVSAKPSAKPRHLRDRWGDQGDGTFINPVLPADYSDIDAIRVGDLYYAISSTIHMSPGMVVLKSHDLVNWEAISHAVPDISVLGDAMTWRQMRGYGRGIWAGAIRYHDDRYWIYFTCPDMGIFVTTATSPEGPWDQLQIVWAAKGYDDPCPFWDTDGQGYLVCSHFELDPETGRSYDIHLLKLAPDGRSLDVSFNLIIHQSKGSEANKLYFINGWYYHYYSEVRAEGRVGMMRRSRSLLGPWQGTQLNHVSKSIDKEPNQGGLVQTQAGDWWFLTHQGSGDWEGRAMCLLPVKWRDGWPLVGQIGQDGIGNMVWKAKKPVQGFPPLKPVTSDGFESKVLAPQWEWNHSPQPLKSSLSANSGNLRLYAVHAPSGGDYTTLDNCLSQRAWRTARNIATTQLDLSGMMTGQSAGLCHSSRTFAGIGIKKHGRKVRLEFRGDEGLVIQGPEVKASRIYLRTVWTLQGRSQFSYSLDGISFENLGPAYQLRWGYYRGDRVGFYCFNDLEELGYVDVIEFNYLIADQSGFLN